MTQSNHKLPQRARVELMGSLGVGTPAASRSHFSTVGNAAASFVAILAGLLPLVRDRIAYREPYRSGERGNVAAT